MRAIVSPWLRELGVTRKKMSYLFHCPKCSFSFFSYRFSDQELARLYSDYRGSNYVVARQKYEGWYSETYNSAHSDPALLEARADVVKSFVSEWVDVSHSHVVDIGGDTGELMEHLRPSSFEVIDPSSRRPPPRRKLVITQGNVFAVSAHTLEHVSNPTKFLDDLLASYRRVYIEIPLGIPQLLSGRKSFVINLLALVASYVPPIWRRFSAASAGRTVVANVLRQSEHLQFFSEDSLRRMAESVNAEVVVRPGIIPTPDNQVANILQAWFVR